MQRRSPLKLGAASAVVLALAGGSVALVPTSIGANPQLSVYGISNRLAQGVAHRLTGQQVALA